MVKNCAVFSPSRESAKAKLEEIARSKGNCIKRNLDYSFEDERWVWLPSCGGYCGMRVQKAYVDTACTQEQFNAIVAPQCDGCEMLEYFTIA